VGTCIIWVHQGASPLNPAPWGLLQRAFGSVAPQPHPPGAPVEGLWGHCPSDLPSGGSCRVPLYRIIWVHQGASPLNPTLWGLPSPTCFTDCPWALFTVIPKANATGNWHHLRTKFNSPNIEC